MKRRGLLSLVFICVCSMLSARTVYVSATDGSNTNDGSKEAPYATISQAARLAIAGDTVLISSGTYREWVSPANGGLTKRDRITYMAAPNEQVKLKGSEVVTGWRKAKGGVWQVKVDNKIFGDFNPFDIYINGDWMRNGDKYHLGAIYLNESALDEVFALEEVAQSVNSWYAQVEDDYTLLTANFESNPNSGTTEINVRPACFFPKTTGVNFITVDGLNISQAATQWSAPTSEQVGIIGPNWSKGWVISNCEISNSRCVGVCLGKERASGHNLWTLYRGKKIYTHHGFNREIEAIFKAYDLGWSMENIGSHHIHNNYIHHCGQAGIVGHLGVINSVISNNRIDHINFEDSLVGWEIAGIKLHAAIDCIVENNYITNTRRGMWFDWQAQGAHIRGNVIEGSITHDIWLEVFHGPTMIYNNIFASETSLVYTGAQGMALFNNIFFGKMETWSSQERYTPYHYPHSTKIKGLFSNPDGDVKYYNNIFAAYTHPRGGLTSYDAHPVASELPREDHTTTADHNLFITFKFPVWTGGNVYYNGAKPYKKEVDGHIFDGESPEFKLEQRGDEVYMVSNVDLEKLFECKSYRVDTDLLGQALISEAIFENVDATPLLYDRDITGAERDVDAPGAGPILDLSRPVWTK